MLMLDGHFDFGNGYHGRVYLNPHQLFVIRPRSGGSRRTCSTCCRPRCARRRPRSWPVRSPAERCSRTRWRACSTAAARYAARRRSSRRSAWIRIGGHGLSRFYRQQVEAGECSSWTTCATPARRSRAARRSRGGRRIVIATAEIYDRMEAVVDGGRAERCARRIQGAGELSGRDLPGQVAVPITSF